MDTISDYIQWMSDYPCLLTGFHEPDAVLLSLLSYIDYAPVIRDIGESFRLRAAVPYTENDGLPVMITGVGKNYNEILRLAAQSVRYGNMILENYLDLQRDDPPLQFSAVCFKDEAFSFIAFRGTDSSLAGWKEDFMISFTRTEAQKLALKYAQNHITPGQHWYMGGHSKGGNELLYAASLLSEEQWNLVDRIFLLDGPGLCPEVMDLEVMKRLDGKTTRIIPEFSVVGKLFEPQITDSRILRSTATGILQHDPSTWGIDHGKLAVTAENDHTSRWISETLDQWVRGITQEERPVFVNELFAALSAGGAGNLEDFNMEKLRAAMKHIGSFSEITRNTISDLPKQAFRTGFEQLRQRVEGSVQDLENKIKKPESESADTIAQ